MATTNREEEAVCKLEMISPKEAYIRLMIGRCIIGITIVLWITMGADAFRPGVWTVLAGMGLMLDKTGRDSQWGCIITGKWNPEGKGIRSVPKEFYLFMQRKKFQFYWNLFMVALQSVGIINLGLFFTHGFTWNASWLIETVLYMAGALVVTLGISLAS